MGKCAGKKKKKNSCVSTAQISKKEIFFEENMHIGIGYFNTKNT